MRDDDIGRRSDRRDLDALRVDDHRVADPERWRMVGGGDEHRVLDRARVHQRAPVVLLERSAHPLRGNEEHVCAGIGERSPDLGEPQVVAGHQTEPQTVELERLRLGQLAGLDPVGLALPERVVQVKLAVHGDHSARIHRDNRVAHAPTIGGLLDESRDDHDAVRLRQPSERRDERTVEGLGMRGERVVERVDEVARVLGEDHHCGTAVGCRRRELADDGEVRRLVSGRRELCDGDRRGARAGSAQR